MEEKEKKLDSVVATFTWCKFPKNIDNSNSQFRIIEAKDLEDARVTIKGNNLPTDKSFPYKFFGKWETNKKYGQSFNCSYFEVVPPNDIAQIEKFMISFINGIGKINAKKFTKKYGKDTLEALKSFEKIRAVVKEKTARRIYESAAIALGDQKLFMLLMNVNINPQIVDQISRDLGAEAVEKIQENPFCLKDYKISFNKLNKLAIEFKAGLNSDERIDMAIDYFLGVTNSNAGDCYAELCTCTAPNSSVPGKAIKGIQRLLNNGMENKYCVPVSRVQERIKVLRGEKILHMDKNGNNLYISNNFFYTAEKYIAEKIAKMACVTDLPKFDNASIYKSITDVERKYNVTLADSQKLAVQTVLNNKFSVITGSAGTGKTTVMRFCIELFIQLIGGRVLLVAPTGRASRRMAEATMIGEASTIHSLLAITKDDDPTNPAARNQVDADIVFVDETSMCDTSIVYKLLYNSSENTRFVFIGDPQQLPSVGAGDVLNDIIKSGVIPTVKLDVIYRQCQDSHIIGNANKIINGSPYFDTGDDFEFYELNDSLKIKEKVVDLFETEYHKIHDLTEVQVITPMREKGELSALSINKAIQERLNPISKDDLTISANNCVFHQNDKIICQVNTQTVKNGDMGIIKCIKKDEGIPVAIIDFFGSEEEFTKKEFISNNVSLAYAITVHKSQGSEFKSVILPINQENKVMLKRNLLYTAITRASKKMTIVGTKRNYADAVVNNKVKIRNTHLSTLLTRYYGKEQQS